MSLLTVVGRGRRWEGTSSGFSLFISGSVEAGGERRLPGPAPWLTGSSAALSAQVGQHGFPMGLAGKVAIALPICKGSWVANPEEAASQPLCEPPGGSG